VNVSIRTARRTLKPSVLGGVFFPGDHGYDEARRAWNLSVDQRPAVVAFPQSAEEVVYLVRFAAAQGLRVAPQATGHGAGPLEPLEGTLLLRTSRMRGVRIFPSGRRARAEAGARWQDVTGPAGAHGLAALAGTSPNVGVAGYTLGGGIGWLARRYGLAANSVTAVGLVTPDGRLVHAGPDREPDLFWAVRGGGGGVGVVTALEMALYSVRALYAGALFFPIRRSDEVLHAWRRWTDSVPDELTSSARLMRLPPLPALPEPLRGRALAAVEAAYVGDAATGADILAPLRALGPEMDTFAMIPAAALGQLHMDPAEPVPASGDGGLLADLPPDAINELVALAGPHVESPLLSVEVRHLGGALAREDPDAGAQGKLDAGYAWYAAGFTPTRDRNRAVRSHVQAIKAALGAWRGRYDYYNFVESPSGADQLLPASSYRRLREIKARYDPGQAIVSSHPVHSTRG
jgi:FAD/FMN-containing dehydrogenase